MKRCVVLLLAVALSLSAAAAWSYPTFDGASGIVTLPSAETAPSGTVGLALDYQKISSDVQVWAARVNVAWVTRLNSGLATAR